MYLSREFVIFAIKTSLIIMANSCIPPNLPRVEELAKKFGRNVKLVATMLGTWQQSSPENKGRLPSDEEFERYLKSRHPKLDKELFKVKHKDDFARLMRDFTPFTLQDRASDLARDFSSIVSRELDLRLADIDDAINEEQSSEFPNPERLSSLYDKRDAYLGPRGRFIVMQDVTIAKIFDEIGDEYRSTLSKSNEELDALYGPGRGAYIRQEYSKIMNNFNALLTEACLILENTEHLRIVTEYYNQSSTSAEIFGGEVQESSEEVESTEEQFSDDEDGSRATGNDGWSFQVRFIDPYSTLSKEVKEVLSSIVRVQSDGITPDLNDLGKQRYLNPEYTHTALLDAMSSMVDADDFSVKDRDGNWTFPALERARAKYPWVSQVISALQENPSLIGSFYADLRKDFISYWMQYTNREGIQIPKALNRNNASESALNAAQNNYSERQVLDSDSLYSKSGSIDHSKAAIGDKEAAKVLDIFREGINPEDIQTIKGSASKVFRMLGFDIEEGEISNLIQSPEGSEQIQNALNAARNIFQGSLKVDTDSNLTELFDKYYKIIADNIGIVRELDIIASFRDLDKTRYSYSTPNYIDTMIKSLKDDARREDYLESEFGQYEWFKRNGRWRSHLLEQLADEGEEGEAVRFNLATKEVVNINGTEYSKWRPMDIRTAFVNEYAFQEENRGSKYQFAWYNMPIFSDSPVVKFIRLPRYTGDFKSQILPLLREVVKQELWRIDLVEHRIANGAPEIQNFDTRNSNGEINGLKFNFFPELNDGNFLQQCKELIRGKKSNELNSLIDSRVNEIMNNLFEDFISKNTGIHASNLVSLGAIQDSSQERAFLEEYFWNQAYATTQIIELTTTDLAFYKDDVEFQKRYKEVYASGTKLNTNAAWDSITHKAERTKTHRTAMYLADNEITSSTFSDLKSTLDEAVRRGMIQSFDRDNILNKFRKINETDAQAYVSPYEMRDVLSMMGKWSDEMDASLERFEKGEWDMSDFNTLWQTIKPFVYTQLAKPSGLNDGRMIKVPHQNKNSEFMLLAAYNVIANSLGMSPQLRALQDFMTKNKIDVIQFQSAVKVGGQGVVNINYSRTKLEKFLSEKKLPLKSPTFKELKKFLDDKLTSGDITQDDYNKIMESLEPDYDETIEILTGEALQNGQFRPEVVHEIPYRDYVIQQPTPEHLIDVEAVFGSQLRNLAISDLPDDFKVIINGVEFDKNGLVSLYNKLIVENLLKDYQELSKRFQDIHSLQKALLSQVKGNVKYSRDIIDALQIVKVIDPFSGKEAETFKMPLNNPSVTLKLQELVNSMFKNGITKQHIKGGNAILVSNFGLTHELQVIYNKEGDKTSGVKGIECYLPASSRQFYTSFMKRSSDGKYQYLDISKMPVDLRRLIGYRIPTEGKYSMAPLIVKGFLPQQNGSAIMLPADITTIAGSDFDIDKMFLMIPEFRVVESVNWVGFKHDVRRVFRGLSRNDLDIIVDEIINGEIAFSEDTQEMRVFDYFTEHKSKYTTTKVKKVKYNITKNPQDNSREQRNNMLIDIIQGVLTHPDMADKVVRPGNFDNIKLQARITRIITDPALLESFKQEFGVTSNDEIINKLLGFSRRGELKPLNDFMEKYRRVRSQLTLETFVYNHVQNMTGAALIGMYANNTTAQAKYQYSNLGLKYPIDPLTDDSTPDFRFKINGRTIQSLHDVEVTLKDGTTMLISKNCAEFSAASVDNVKDPVLADLLQNPNTAKVTAFMLRAGMSIEEISLLFAQPLVSEYIRETGTLEGLGRRIDDYTTGLLTRKDLIVSSVMGLRDFSSYDLMNIVLLQHDPSLEGIGTFHGLFDTEASQGSDEMKKFAQSNVEAALLMNHIVSLSDYLAELTQISRADSPNGAILNTLAGAKVQVAKVNRFNDMARGRKFPFVGVGDALSNNIVYETMTKDQLRDYLTRRMMPMLQSFYSLGIELGTKLVGRYFQQINPYSDAMLQTVFDNAPLGFLSNMNQQRAIKLVNHFYKDLVTFALSSTRTFGDDGTSTFEEKRDYYLNEYPTEFLAQKSRNPEIAKLGLFSKMTVDENNRIIVDRSARLRPQARDQFMRDMEALRYMGGEALQMAEDLFKYAYYAEGFNFGPNSFGNFFSTNFFNDYPEVINALRFMKESMHRGTFYDRFLPQFYANHFREGIVPYVSNEKGESSDMRVTEAEDGSIFVPIKKSFNRTTNVGEYPYVVYNGRLYQFALEATTNGKTTYVPATSFENPRYKYNANMTIDEMKEYDRIEQPDEENTEDVVPEKVVPAPSQEPMAFDESFDFSNIGDIDGVSASTIWREMQELKAQGEQSMKDKTGEWFCSSSKSSKSE